MAVQSEIFSTNYGVRSFASTKHIGQKQNMAVWLQRRSDNLWVQLSQSNYELINNSAVLTTAPNSTTYSQVEIRVADTPDELGSSQSEIAVLAGLYDEIVALNGIKNDITTVAGISGDVTTVSSNILDINSVVTNIVPNLAEILQADTNATIATTKAAEASASATSASNSATTATNQATIATTKASEASASATSASNSATTATTKASEASASATSASNSATSASNSATTATTKANEASASASLASTSANNASTSETMAYKWSSNPVDTIVETDKYSALHWATKAQEWANSVDASNLVHKNGDETIAGIKTFSSSPVVPTPTTANQAVNKDYVDSSSALPIGVILNAYTIFDNCVVAFGGEFNRADYPKLWTYLQANPSLVKTQAQWQTEATANGGICGYFSSGNGATTFRVPNLDNAFLRPDSRTIASYQADEFKSHSHGLPGNTSNGTTGGSADWNTGSTTSPTYNTSSSGGTETRPKNIAILPLIVAK